MIKWKLKSCPRCGSDMYLEKDFDDLYQKCLMCSYRIDLEHVHVSKVPVTAGGWDDLDDTDPDDDDV